MRPVLAIGIALSLVACTKPANRETGAADRMSADTIVTKQQVKDTAVVRHDTSVSTDTLKKHGGRTKPDTVRK